MRLSQLAPYQFFLSLTWQRRHFLVAVFNYRTERLGHHEILGRWGSSGICPQVKSWKDCIKMSCAHSASRTAKKFSQETEDTHTLIWIDLIS